jgi:hypothetical protein
MGVFAVVGAIIGLIGIAKENATIGILGLIIFGIGVAADSHGY